MVIIDIHVICDSIRKTAPADPKHNGALDTTIIYYRDICRTASHIRQDSRECASSVGAENRTTDGERLSCYRNEVKRQFVGNPLADALQIALRTKLPVANPRERLGLPANLLSDRNGYGVVILDAMPNVGDRQVLSELIAILRAVAHDVPLVWPMHTRTREQLSRFKLDAIVASERIATLPSQSYPSLVQLMSNATCVITDSWNVQEEATVLSIPCLTIGLGQERATTVSVGSNLVVGRNKALATRAMWDCIFNGGKRGRLPELWDGHAATRIAEHMSGFLQARRSARSSVTA